MFYGTQQLVSFFHLMLGHIVGQLATHTYTVAHALIHIPSYAHTSTHARKHTHTYMRAHTHTRTYTCTCTHTSMHILTHTRMHACATQDESFKERVDATDFSVGELRQLMDGQGEAAESSTFELQVCVYSFEILHVLASAHGWSTEVAESSTSELHLCVYSF